jgi:membrane-associated phospholipid phosphatase
MVRFTFGGPSVRHIVGFVCFATLTVVNCGAQTPFPYSLSRNKEIGIAGSGLILNIGGYALAPKIKPLTAADIAGLNAGSIFPAFDQRATRQFSLTAKKRSDQLLLAAYLLPAALALAPQCRILEQGRVVAAMGLETMILSNGLTQLVKNTVRRPRPFTYNADAPVSWKTTRDAQRSFFSGHTSTSASACFFTASVFSALYPNSRWRYAVWSGAAALPLAIGYNRYKAGKHFPTDILTGYIVGGLCGVLVPRWHRLRI